jgi:hypothetical protein
MKSQLILLALVLSVFTSCMKETINGSGAEKTEDRNVTNFTRVEAEGSTQVFVTQGLTHKVQVKGYENLVPFFETTVVNGTLRLGFMNNLNITNNNVQVLITMPVVEGLTLSGSGIIMASGIFPFTNNLDIRLSGSGEIAFENGATANLTTNLSGSGNIKAFGIVAGKAEAITSGSGNTELTALTDLKGTISGSGNIFYKGNPVVVSQITGSGKIEKR